MSSQKMPALFLGHGSPMNALANNEFSNSIHKMSEKIPVPKVILCISAHWQTKGTYITSTAEPKMIYDMYGFPDELYRVKYPAPGSISFAEKIVKDIKVPEVKPDQGQWGLDHGTWSVLVHLFPKANIPVLQLSMDATQSPNFHYELGKKLSYLREEGVLILGSGNIVHNLRKLDWNNPRSAHSWAVEFDLWAEDKIIKQDHHSLINNFHDSEAGRLSIPSLEHYLPLLYILGASDKSDQISFDVQGFEMGALSQRSVRFG